MLSAINGEGKVVTLLENEKVQREPFFCPACHGAVRLKQGKILRKHFAHLSLRDCHFYHENESAEHLELKARLFTSLAANHKVEVEKVLPALQQIADLLVFDKLALEVQCSRLSIERLCERTQAYRKAGYQVLWLLGKKLWLKDRLSPLQKQFLYFSQNMGFHLWELDLEQCLVRLKYLIHEDLKGNCHYLSQTAHFSDDLLAFFRLPFQKQGLSSYCIEMDTQFLVYLQRQLYYRQPKWLALQAEYYQKGDNLLSKSLTDFYPQVIPVKSDMGFLQFDTDLERYYQYFYRYYQKQACKERQVLYPPAFYDKIERNKP